MADAAVSIAVPDEFAQHARWRSFRDRSVESRYRAWHRDQVLPIARALGFFGILGWGLVPVSWELWVGESSRVMRISCWAIAVPVFVIALIGTYTRLRLWATEIVSLIIVVLGLTMTWSMSTIYGPTSGMVAGGVIAMIFYPMVVRTPTLHAAFVMAVLTPIPLALQIRATVRGELAPAESWAWVALLIPSSGAVVLTAAIIESGMRRQFVAESTAQASQRLLRRYAPAAVADRIETGDAKAVGQPQRLRVTALSSDVAGFTALADQIDPESLSQIINEFMATMSDVVESQGGVVTEFAGDGLMAIFGAPEALEPEEQVRRALSAANAMHSRLAELNQTWFRFGIEQPLRVRIGINTGMLSVGTFGSDGRATYTAIGLQMNVAARIQAQCEPGGILLSSASWHLVNDTVECDPLGEVSVKGVHFPISVYAPRTSADRGHA
jgi:class 3 adenylate cyclase